jgi:hypothetical protein
MRGVLVARVCAGAVAWAVGPALADGTDPAYPGSLLHVTASGPLTPGSVLTITATGTNVQPMGISIFNFGLDLSLVSADLLPVPCAVSESQEGAISVNNAQAVKLLTFDDLNEGGPVRSRSRFR